MNTILHVENKNFEPSFTRDILLVEDNPADIRLIEEALKDEITQNRLHIVVDGVEALNYLYEECEHNKADYPNLIILDLNLPKKNGFEFLEEIKNNLKLCNIPIIVFTTSSLEENKMKCYEMGVYAYITKPVDFEGFEQIIKLIKKL